ncbi:MAG: response regulator transcription factor [Chitinophagaceae bacterium]|jgi:DNA-binding NarL/FixJ family response regulator|nr:response regulator transcription factor [Chitinophagaceae bacterium]
MINILKTVNFSIADADLYFKEILVKSLRSNPFWKLVKNCNNGNELINQLYRKQENIFLIDLYMPILSGVETIKIIRSTGNTTPIITYSAIFQEDVHSFLTSHSNIFYCQKNSAVILDILKNCVLSQIKNYAGYLEEWKRKPLVFHKNIEREEPAHYIPSLTEIQIMKLCYEGLSNKEIGERLYFSTRTVDTYITSLTKKLGLRNKIDLIRFCVEQGYYNSSD